MGSPFGGEEDRLDLDAHTRMSRRRIRKLVEAVEICAKVGLKVPERTNWTANNRQLSSRGSSFALRQSKALVPPFAWTNSSIA